MKTLLTVIAVLSLGRSLDAQENIAARQDMRQNAELRQRAVEWKDAYNSNNADALAAFYTEDAEYVSPHVSGLIIRGWDRIKQNFQRGVAMGGHVDSIQVLTSDSSCDLGYMVCRYVATNGGVTVSGRNVLVLKKIRGTWLITTHASIVRD